MTSALSETSLIHVCMVVNFRKSISARTAKQRLSKTGQIPIFELAQWFVYDNWPCIVHLQEQYVAFNRKWMQIKPLCSTCEKFHEADNGVVSHIHLDARNITDCNSYYCTECVVTSRFRTMASLFRCCSLLPYALTQALTRWRYSKQRDEGSADQSATLKKHNNAEWTSSREYIKERCRKRMEESRNGRNTSTKTRSAIQAKVPTPWIYLT